MVVRTGLSFIEQLYSFDIVSLGYTFTLISLVLEIMSRERESNYGGQDDNEYTMSHIDYDASSIEDMGECYTNNDPHDMIDHHQDFRYDDSDYSSINDMERYHDSDYTSANENKVKISTYVSSYGTDFHYNDMVDRYYYAYNSNDMVANVYNYQSSSMCDEIDYTINNMQEERKPITTMFKSDTTFHGSSSRWRTDNPTLHSSYGAPSPS